MASPIFLSASASLPAAASERMMSAMDWLILPMTEVSISFRRVFSVTMDLARVLRLGKSYL
jgi:hypothetical protein